MNQVGMILSFSRIIPRMAAFAEEIGCKPAMQFGELPHSFATRFASKLGLLKTVLKLFTLKEKSRVHGNWK